jgi:hypothetical protein
MIKECQPTKDIKLMDSQMQQWRSTLKEVRSTTAIQREK